MHGDENIAEALRPQAEAALAWLKATWQRSYEWTAIVDTEAALSAGPGEAYDLGLVLCDGELCAREQVRVHPGADGLHFSLVDAPARAIPPLLDPPVGVRSRWLDTVLSRHEFVLLLFYRGLW